MKAITDPNKGNTGSSMGPKNSETKKRVKRTAAFQTMGPMEMTAMRIKGLGGNFPSGLGNDFTNMYAMTKRTAMNTGKITSEKMTARQVARGTSPDNFSDG